jgi:hypothetical protein
LTVRDYFAIHGPAPTRAQIEAVADRERYTNPENDPALPTQRSWQEIDCALRYAFADAMIAERSR